jgi:23S rRNA (adenine-N6)-dimethyltransferase
VSAAGRRRWGWHRLQPEWASRIVAAAPIRPGDLVLDLGAGTGALTGPLVRAGARVIAVELHPGRAARLRDRFASQPVQVLQTDLTRVRLPREPYRVVANPPYAVSAALLRRLLAAGTRLESADLLLPRWVVARYAAGRGAGAGRWSRTYDAAAGRRLPRHAFVPPPPSDWAVLTLRRTGLDRRRRSG